MATKGLGACLIAGDNGLPCGRQISEGEPIGTVAVGHPPNPIVGHKKCADAWALRKQREKDDMVRIGKQQGPGGSIGDPASYDDGIQGSIPLEKPEPLPSLAEVKMPEGVQSLAELPFVPPKASVSVDGRPYPLTGSATTAIPEDQTKGQHLRADLANRFTYHSPTPEQIPLYESIRGQAKLWADYLVMACPESRELSLALTHLEETVMWANASIARHS